jgi:hypothetical protein
VVEQIEDVGATLKRNALVQFEPAAHGGIDLRGAEPWQRIGADHPRACADRYTSCLNLKLLSGRPAAGWYDTGNGLWRAARRH